MTTETVVDPKVVDPETGKLISASAQRMHEARSNILFAFAVGIALTLAYHMRNALLLLYVSALFAVVLMPLIHFIMRLKIFGRNPNRAVAIVLVLAAVTGGITLFFMFAMPPVIRDLSTFTKELPSRGPQLLGRLRKIPLASHTNTALLNARLQGYVSNFAEYMVLSITDWASKVADIMTVIVLTIYFILEGDLAYHWALLLFPQRVRLRLDRTLMRAQVRMGKWLIGQGTLMLILGLLSTTVFTMLKIRYAAALGVLMGALNIVPVLGGVVSIVLVVLVAALDSWGKVIGALIFYGIYVQVETTYLTPRIMQTSVNLIGLAILAALLLGSKLAGVVGAIIAIPTAVLISVLIEEYALQGETLDG
jgi:predicted PurR-regulated permease PerM